VSLNSLPEGRPHRDPALELLENLGQAASERVGRELDDLRAHLIKCCEHTIERLRKGGFVALESVTPVVDALTAVAASERDRANHLASLLKSAEAELESLRAACQSQRETDDRDRRETTARLEQELQDAREGAVKAADEKHAELTASRHHFQRIIDAQSLQLVELKRQLEKPNNGVAPLARPSLEAGRPLPSVRERLAETLPFDAIDAALSATPPVSEWPKAV
jgi:Skp family chaperone for outer membrane proteins